MRGATTIKSVSRSLTAIPISSIASSIRTDPRHHRPPRAALRIAPRAQQLAQFVHVAPRPLVIQPERRQRPPRPRLARLLDQRAQRDQVHAPPLRLRHQARQQRFRAHLPQQLSAAC